MIDLSKLRILSDEEMSQLRLDNPGVNFNVEKWCPTCDGEQVYRYQGQQVDCNCEEQMMLFKHYLVSGIGKGYHRLSWRDYAKDLELTARLVKYTDNPKPYVDEGVGFLFHGPPGTGKTMLTNLILKDLVQAGYRCYATAAADTTTNLTAGWRDKKDRKRYEEVYINSHVLLLDDVGRDLIEDRTGEVLEASKFKESVLDTILRKRVQYARPTILTTNLTPENLEEAYGGAVRSLLQENTLVVGLTGDDFRQTMVKRKLELIEAGERAPIT